MTKNNSSITFVCLMFVLFVTGTQLASAKDQDPASPRVVALTDQTWVCDGPVDIDSLTVTITPAAVERRDQDAVHLRPGCTGRIGEISITQYMADGIKVAEGVHDLTIGGGSIKCLAKAPIVHQDGIQVMGGARITFRNLDIDCGREDDRLIDSDFFINQAGKSTTPPSDIVCDGCTLGGWTAHTANIQSSLRSGLVNSTLCVGRFPRLTMTVADDAVDALTAGNLIKTCA